MTWTVIDGRYFKLDSHCKKTRKNFRTMMKLNYQRALWAFRCLFAPESLRATCCNETHNKDSISEHDLLQKDLLLNA